VTKDVGEIVTGIDRVGSCPPPPYPATIPSETTVTDPVNRPLLPVPAPSGAAVAGLLPDLRAALSGSGPALLLHDPAGPPPPELAPGSPLGPGEDSPEDPTVAIVVTSGSTGTPKGVLLSASSLLASVNATHDRLGGPGRWLLALPTQHVAGMQVLLRSLVSGTVPGTVDLSGGFTPEAFADASAHLTAPRRYTALVPTQLLRLLDAGGRAAEALASFDAVLVGGAALPAPLRDRAETAGVRIVSTYGMSETCGGCVYDGQPLDGVQIRIDPEDSTISLTGPVLARGYRTSPDHTAFSHDPDGRRWFRTDDLGHLDGTALVVDGRADDIIITGGKKVAPTPVETALQRLPSIDQAVVVGATDPRWGQRVVAVVVPTPGGSVPDPDTLRRQLQSALPPQALPRQVLVLDRLPLLGPGKPDRAALIRRAEGE
jgi:o-succinylbenzoate---CoA ligase